MHAGKVLVSDTPAGLIQKRGTQNLEEAFIAYLEDAVKQEQNNNTAGPGNTAPSPANGKTAELTEDITENKPQVPRDPPSPHRKIFSFARAFSYTRLETLQLQRDPVRRTLALLGTALLMFIMGYGISMDVEDLTFAVLDRDQTTLSQNYTLNLSGSRYFIEKPPIKDYEDLDQRMRSGEISLALEIPPGFARDIKRGVNVEIGAWADGANPQRAETVQGYALGMHQSWLATMARERLGVDMSNMALATIEPRFRYNPDVKSLPAMVPAVIPLLLLMIPAMLSALSVVREKELGSITNLYVTPVTRSEFLLGKQVPYVVLGMMNFLLMAFLAVTVFDVPVKGNFLALCLAAFLYVLFATGIGLFASSFTKSQIAAMFFTMVGTLLPAIQFSGLLNPVSSLEGAAAFIGNVFPTTYFLMVSRGIFNKALGFFDLADYYLPILLGALFILAMAIMLLRKQDK